MNERIFIDENGQQLIVRHRKSAVFFLRETDLGIPGFVSPFWVGDDRDPCVEPTELKREYKFSSETLKGFISYMEEIGSSSWSSLNPREADSVGSDYFEYYDREFDNNGYLGFKSNALTVDGPMQKKTKNSVVRLYKFNKRKFESFIYDLRKVTGRHQSN